MTKAILALLLVTAGGCVEGTEHSLAEGGIRAIVETGYSDSTSIAIELLLADPPPNAGGACAIMRDDLRATANGVPGNLVETGGYYLDDNGCTPARIEVPFSPIPSEIEMAIDDGSARLRVTVARDARQEFRVTLCEFTECSVY